MHLACLHWVQRVLPGTANALRVDVNRYSPKIQPANTAYLYDLPCEAAV
jgi:hypothetical protein